MYAQHGYAPKSSRTVGLSGSLLVCAGMMTVMATMLAPKIIPIEKVFGEPIVTYNVPKDEPPPPVEPVKPTEVLPRTPLITVPKPVVEPPLAGPTIHTTDVITPPLPPLPPVGGTGGGAGVVEPVKPATPPYIGAAVDPRYASGFQPDYPSQEIRLGREGRVTVRVLVGTDGRVKAVEKVNATSDAFFEATRSRALAKWRFKPATRGGTPEESWKQYSVKFVLNDG